MANYNPPLENLPIFDNGVFVSPDTALTIDYANKHYLKYPTAQGTENLLAINVAGLATMLSGIDIADNTNKSNIDQNGAGLIIDNNVNGGTINLVCSNSSGAQSTPLTVSTSVATISSQNCNINASGSTVINTPTLTFNSTNPPTCSASYASVPANDSSTKIPTTAWVQTAISGGSNLLSSNNTWTGTQNFSNTGTGSLVSSAVQPASTDSSTKIPTTAWVQSAITANASPILSSVGYYPAFNKTIGVWQTFNTTTGTQFVDIYTIAGGGALGNTATNPTLGWGKGIGGSGGGGGMVLNSRVSLGGYSNALGMLIQPQFVVPPTNSAGQTTNTSYTSAWTGTFTQNNTTITLTSTTSGAMGVGAIIYYTKSAYETAYPSATAPYGAYFNQLQVVSGSGNTWQVQTQQGQTLATAISATAYIPELVWEGTFTQSGNTITVATTTAGGFNFDTVIPSYLLVNGTANNTQFLTGFTTQGSVLTVNTQMTISTPIAGRIVYVRAGCNILTRYWSYGPGMNNGYTYFPYIAWCEGGFRGANGSTNGTQEFGGAGGYGGQAVCYLPYGSQISQGARGQNGGVNDDPSGFTKVSGQGGYSLLTNGKDSLSINGATTPYLYQYNQGASSNSPSAFAVNVTPAGQGGMVLVCYKY